MTRHALLEHLAWSALPAAGYVALAATGNQRIGRILVSNPDTPPEVLTQLTRCRGMTRFALARTSDPTLLTAEVADRSQAAAAGVAGNPASPPELLAALIGHHSKTVRLAAAQNPATPADAIMHVASGYGSLDAFLGRGGSNAGAGARYARVVTAHPALAPTWLAFVARQRSGRDLTTATATRGVARVPGLPMRSARAVLALGRNAGQKVLALNPTVPVEVFGTRVPAARRRLEAFLNGRTVEDVLAGSTTDLIDAVRLGSPTLDLLIAGRADVPMLVALEFFRSGPNRRAAAEADVLGSLVDRLGPELAVQGRRLVSSTRWRAVCDHSWLAEEAADGPSDVERAAVARAAVALGEDRSRWEIVRGMVDGWDRSVVELLDVAARL